MLKNVYQSPFLNIGFEDTEKIFYNSWSNSADRMTDAELKKIMTDMVEVCRTHKPRGLLAINLKFTLSPEMQVWIAEVPIAEMIGMGCKKVAIMIPEDVFVQMSMEQFADESAERNASEDSTKLFADMEEAKKWLMS